MTCHPRPRGGLARVVPLWCLLGLASVPAYVAGQATGDAGRGQALFEANGCYGCHRVGERGSHAGPDLSDIGARRTADRLTESLVSPDAEVLPENRYARLVSSDGVVVTGRLLNQDAFSVQVITTTDELKSFLRRDLREYTILMSGLMPPVKPALADAQIADVVAYLATLKRP
jgi:putative heme-binding domain-containing protein